MPIVIKELFPSDPLSEALEKINFNFDQVILSGGGPIGPLGPQGVPGIPGPQGDRGDHWQVGTTAPTADHGPNYGALKDYDFWISATGQIYYWSVGTTSWINSGKNLTGPTGSPGATGGSYEIQMYQGHTGNANTPFSIPAVTAAQNYTPGLGGATTVPSGGVDFIIPANIEKNSFFLGDKNWAYSKLNNFGVYDVYASGNIQRLTPKQVIIQTKIDWTGLGGLSIGAYGATSAIGSTQTNYIGVSTAVTDALNFFTAGFAYKNVGPNYAHFFKMRTGTIDLEISAGDSNFTPLSAGKTPDLILRSNRILISDWASNRITIGATSTIFREKSAFGYSSPPTFDSNSTLDNSGIMRSRGDIYVGALNGLQNTIHIGYARTINGSSALNFYTNGSTPTTANFTIGRVSGANGVATIDQTGTGALQLNSTAVGSSIQFQTSATTGHVRFINTSGGEIARIDSATSRVGIGTTTPSNKLDVVGTEMGLRSGAYGNAGSLQFINSTGSPVSSRIAFGADGTNWKLAFAKNISGTFTDLMTLESFGNLGIGTITPNAKLDVYGSINIHGGLNVNSTRPAISIGTLTNGEIRGYSTSASTSDDGFLRLSAGGGYQAAEKSFIDITGFSNVADMNRTIRFGTWGVERIRINQLGYLGIMTTDPQYRVHIEGDSPNSILIRSKNASITDQNNILLQRSNLTAATPNNYSLGGISFGGYDGTNWSEGWNGGSQILSRSSATWTTISKPSDITFLTTPINTTATVERMRILSDGNIEIGAETDKEIRLSSTASATGFNFSIKGGSINTGVSNGIAGNLVLGTGQSTGSGTSNIIFQGLNTTASAIALRTYATRAVMNELGKWAFGHNTPNSSYTIDVTGGIGVTGGIVVKDTGIKLIGTAASTNVGMTSPIEFKLGPTANYESEIRGFRGDSDSEIGLSFRTCYGTTTAVERMRIFPSGGISIVDDAINGSISTYALTTGNSPGAAGDLNVLFSIASTPEDRIIYVGTGQSQRYNNVYPSAGTFYGIYEIVDLTGTVLEMKEIYFSNASGQRYINVFAHSFILSGGSSFRCRGWYTGLAWAGTPATIRVQAIRFGKI